MKHNTLLPNFRITVRYNKQEEEFFILEDTYALPSIRVQNEDIISVHKQYLTQHFNIRNYIADEITILAIRKDNYPINFLITGNTKIILCEDMHTVRAFNKARLIFTDRTKVHYNSDILLTDKILRIEELIRNYKQPIDLLNECSDITVYDDKLYYHRCWSFTKTIENEK